MELKLNPELYKRAIDRGLINSMKDIEKNSGLAYVTILKMVKGKFSKQALRCLADYLTGLGFNPYEIAEMKFNDIFQMRE
jgi:hypothetical protein